MNYPKKILIYSKQVYTCQSSQIKFENPKSSLPLKGFIVYFLKALIKSEETKSQIKAHLSYLANFFFYNYKLSLHTLCQHCVLQNLRNIKDIIITKLVKENGVVILDRITLL